MFGQITYSTNFAWLKCEHDLGRLYRRLFLSTFGIKLERPSNGEHITLLSEGERQKIKDWKWREGESLIFSLDSQLYTNGNAYWVEVNSTDIQEFRKQLGLGPLCPKEHFCIGYLHD